MLMRVAAYCGYPFLDALGDRLSMRELVEWQVWLGIEGDREHRAEMRHGTLCALVASLGGGKGESTKPQTYMFDPDTAPRGGRGGSELSIDQIKSGMDMLVRMTGGGKRRRS